MGNIFRLMCCRCCWCCVRESFDKNEAKIRKHERLKALEEITPSSESDVWAVTKDPLKVKTQEMTKTFVIPNRKLRTENDVFKTIGFKIEKQIESGSFGIILSGYHLNKKLKIAIKKIVLPEASDTKRANRRDEMMKDVKHELFTLEKIIHPHVIKLITHLMIRNRREDSLYILMQFAENETLMKYCEKYGIIAEDKCKLWFAQMLSGLSYIHREGIAHRDLKLSNILLDSAFDVLITDFGLSRLVWRQSQELLLMSNTYCGTPPYMAPEVLILEKQKYREYNAFLADVWSLGVILFRMYCGEYPFPNKPNKAIKYMKKKKWKFPKKCHPSASLKNIMKRMLEPNPKKRPRTKILQTDNWIRDVFITVEMKSIERMKEKERTFKFS